jgi:peptidoglycan/LPS O-acetylase OafA/YrhL
LQPGRLQRAFSHRVLVMIGTASYSIYLWQQLFLTPAWASGWGLPTGVAVVLALVAGLASRRFIEMPFLAPMPSRGQAAGEAT